MIDLCNYAALDKLRDASGSSPESVLWDLRRGGGCRQCTHCL